MKSHLRAAIFGLGLMLPSAVLADNCDQPNLTGFDSVYCFSKVYLGEDARLNANYQTLRGHLSSSQTNTLRTSQRNWISMRDRTCMTGPTTVNVNCALSQTRARADWLQARITECRSVGCATSRLNEY
ncbi:lysozyme inhibitor LprI family protein [Aestuariibius sp. HNIBRBA575]|uniref:lysozyme inhibitor LprI family protein n=1 Tax=Aestuariibius sp. HNIBRBA575 TaxID=3233343 RepID=UPI0034A54DD5